MRNGTCPKCNSDQIYARQAVGERNLMTHEWGGDTLLAIMDFVCGDCGYIESYLVNADLPLIRDLDEWKHLSKLKHETAAEAQEMHEGLCPKCNSAEVYSRQAVGARNLSSPTSGIIIIVDYVCGDCGYLESYTKPEDLKQVRQSWQRVTKSKRKNDDLAKRKKDETE
jgi:predicted nucleic-acid-binding Zn-ribbon protein